MRVVLSSRWARLTAVAAVVTLSIVEWIGFPWRMPLVALIATAIVLAEAGTTAPMGLRWPRHGRATLLWAFGIALAAIALSTWVEPLFEQLTGVEVDYSGYAVFREDLSQAVRLGAGAWLSAALGEEIVFRGFLLHELSSVMGTRHWRLPAVVMGSAVLFGFAHADQELPGVLLTGTIGVLFGAAFFASGRNLVALILAHGLVDTWGLFTLYRGWY